MTIGALGGRTVALGASALAHAAVVAAAVLGGHAPAGDPRGAARTEARAHEVMLEVESPPFPMPAPPAPPAPLPSRERMAGVPHAHTHPYPVDPDHDAHPHDPSLVHAPYAPPPVAPRAADQAPSLPSRTTDPPAHFTLAVGGTTLAAGVSSASAVSSVPTGAPGAGGGAEGATVMAAADVSVQARCTAASPLRYPPEAARAGVEADVPLEIVVDAAGVVRDARVLSPAGYGLDRVAVEDARAMRCTPARREGRSVAVRMRWRTSFRLQN